MNWINLNVATLDSPEFLGAEPTQRATWLCLMRYCVGQENSGIIQSCASWRDRQWQQVVRVTKDEVMDASGLWVWNGDNLHITFFPTEKQAEVQVKRLAAANNGKKGGRPKGATGNQRKTNVGNPAETQQEPTLVNSQKPSGNQRDNLVKEREEKDKGKELELELESECAADAATNEKPIRKASSAEEAERYALSIGCEPGQGTAFFFKMEGCGWVNNKAPVKNWKATVQSWKYHGYLANPAKAQHQTSFAQLDREAKEAARHGPEVIIPKRAYVHDPS